MKKDNNNNLSHRRQRRDKEIVRAKVKVNQMLSQANKIIVKVKKNLNTVRMIIIKEKRRHKESKLRK